MNTLQQRLGALANDAPVILPRGHRYTALQADARNIPGLICYWYINGQQPGSLLETNPADGGKQAPPGADVITSRPGELVVIPPVESVRLHVAPRGPWSVDDLADEAITVIAYEPGDLTYATRRGPSPGELVFHWSGQHGTEPGTDYTLVDSDWLNEANGLPLCFRAELRGGRLPTGLTTSYFWTNFPTELVLLQGAGGALSKTWLYPGDGEATIVGAIDAAPRRVRPSGSADRWRLVARNPLAGSYADPVNTCHTAVSLFVGHARESVNYRLRNRWSGISDGLYFAALPVSARGRATSSPNIMPTYAENRSAAGSAIIVSRNYLPTLAGGPMYWETYPNFLVASGARSASSLSASGHQVVALGYSGAPTDGDFRVDLEYDGGW